MKMKNSYMTKEEKIRFIIKNLSENKDRYETAKELGYSTYKSMDIFLNRQGYKWNRYLKNYFKEGEDNLKDCTREKWSCHSESTDMDKHRDREDYIRGLNKDNHKANRIIQLISKGKYDFKAVVKMEDFSSYKEMASFMKSKGYFWNDEVNNYVYKACGDTAENIIERDKNSTTAIDNNVDNISSRSKEKVISSKLTHHESNEQYEEISKSFCIDKVEDRLLFKRYLPILEFLEDNKENLYKLLQQQYFLENELPRYRIQGTFITKSVHMSNILDQMVKDYSKENNITQRELFELAIIEFFKKYGYSKEVEILLNSEK